MSRLHMNSSNPEDWTIECGQCRGQACPSCVAPRVYRLEKIEYMRTHSIANWVRRGPFIDYPDVAQ